MRWEKFSFRTLYNLVVVCWEITLFALLKRTVWSVLPFLHEWWGWSPKTYFSLSLSLFSSSNRTATTQKKKQERHVVYFVSCMRVCVWMVVWGCLLLACVCVFLLMYTTHCQCVSGAAYYSMQKEQISFAQIRSLVWIGTFRLMV